MRVMWTVLATAVMSLGLVTTSRALAQSHDDQLSLDKCVGYEACKKIQDKIDSIKAGAGNLANSVSNALTPSSPIASASPIRSPETGPSARSPSRP